MGNKVPWKIGMLIYLPVISRPLIFLAERISFITLYLRDHPFDSLNSDFSSPFNFTTHLLTKNARKFSRIFEPLFCESEEISAKCPSNFPPQKKLRKRGGVQKSMGNKVPWKIGMLIYLPL